MNKETILTQITAQLTFLSDLENHLKEGSEEYGEAFLNTIYPFIFMLAKEYDISEEDVNAMIDQWNNE